VGPLSLKGRPYLQEAVDDLSTAIVFMCREQCRLEKSVGASSNVIFGLYIFPCQSTQSVLGSILDRKAAQTFVIRSKGQVGS